MSKIIMDKFLSLIRGENEKEKVEDGKPSSNLELVTTFETYDKGMRIEVTDDMFYHDSGHMFACSRDGHVHMFNEKGILSSFKHDTSLFSLDYCEKERTIVACDENGCVVCLSCPELEQTKAIQVLGQPGGFCSLIKVKVIRGYENSFVVVSSTGNHLGRVVLVREFLSEEPIIKKIFSNHNECVYSVYQLTTYPHSIVFGGSVNRRTKVSITYCDLNLESDKEEEFRSFEFGHENNISSLTSIVEVGREILVSGSRDHHLIFWDIPSGKIERKIKLETGIFSLIKASNECFFIGGVGKIYAYHKICFRGKEETDNDCIKVLDESEHTGIIRSIDMFGTKNLVTACEDETIKLWRIGHPMFHKLNRLKIQIEDEEVRRQFLVCHCIEESEDGEDNRIEIKGTEFVFLGGPRFSLPSFFLNVNIQKS